jgi:hypothetical protein
MRILQSIGLKVKLPMKLEIYNKGAADFTHTYSVGGGTRHVEVKHFLMQIERGRIDYLRVEQWYGNVE